MKAEVDAYQREYKGKITSLLSLSGLWPEDSPKPRRILFLWSTVSAEVAFFYAERKLGLINFNKVNGVDNGIGILGSSTFFVAKFFAESDSLCRAIHSVHMAVGHFFALFSKFSGTTKRLQTFERTSLHFLTINSLMMDDLVKAYYRDYKGAMVSVLLVSGMWPDDSKQSRILRTILNVISVSMPATLMFGVVNYTIHSPRNILLLVGQIGLVISFGTVCTKMMTMAVMWRGVKSLMGGLSALFESDLKVPENQPHLLAYYRAFYRFFKVYYIYCLGLTVLSTSIPVLAAFRGQYIRVHRIRPPFPYTPGGAVHWIIFVFEVSATALLSLNSIGIDSVFGLFSLQMVGELRLLSHRLRSLKSGQNYKRELKECINRHCMLIDQKYMMDRVFGLTSFLLALSCAAITCSLIYHLTQSKSVSLIQAFFAVDYIAVKLVQAFTYAWFGNTITVESERCVESIYYSAWAESGDVQAMKDVLIIQAQSPMQINALGVMIVRLDMFVKIAHASISYFFLLKTIEAKLTESN